MFKKVLWMSPLKRVIDIEDREIRLYESWWSDRYVTAAYGNRRRVLLFHPGGLFGSIERGTVAGHLGMVELVSGEVLWAVFM